MGAFMDREVGSQKPPTRGGRVCACDFNVGSSRRSKPGVCWVEPFDVRESEAALEPSPPTRGFPIRKFEVREADTKFEVREAEYGTA